MSWLDPFLEDAKVEKSLMVFLVFFILTHKAYYYLAHYYMHLGVEGTLDKMYKKNIFGTILSLDYMIIYSL